MTPFNKDLLDYLINTPGKYTWWDKNATIYTNMTTEEEHTRGKTYFLCVPAETHFIALCSVA